jgi:hypothetical protein
MSQHKSGTGRETGSKTPRRPALTLTDVPRKTTHAERGSDPYNTSGSFDRKKNWTRVGKR